MRSLIFLLCALWTVSVAAQEEVRIGYLALEVDPRYDENFAYARIPLRPAGDTEVAARLAIDDSRMLTDARGLAVTLDAEKVADRAGLVAAATRMAEEGARYIVLDLPADEVDALGAAFEDSGLTLLNATARQDRLRRRCYPNMLHTAASDRMIADALLQHLVFNNWSDVLVLHGKTERDLAHVASFAEAARRLRVDIVETREFDLSTNPTLREQNNVKLLTGGAGDYDVVYIADDYGDFSRYVPYRTALPRLVVGSAGLVPLEWHWALERYGAPQVNSRFEDLSEDGRRMGWQDWSVWAATRAVLTAYAKARGDGPEAVDEFLRSDRLRLDGSKGVPMTFRPWSGQLRMPILLATDNAVIAIAPLEGFLHRTNTLDSLGVDEPEFECE